MKKQQYFDFESITDEVKFSFGEPVKYKVIYVSITWKKDIFDPDDLSFIPSRTEYNHESVKIGRVRSDISDSYFYSLIKQLRQKYDEKAIKNIFRAKPGWAFKSCEFAWYDEEIREIIVG